MPAALSLSLTMIKAAADHARSAVAVAEVIKTAAADYARSSAVVAVAEDKTAAEDARSTVARSAAARTCIVVCRCRQISKILLLSAYAYSAAQEQEGKLP